MASRAAKSVTPALTDVDDEILDKPNTTALGRMESFDPKRETWSFWHERLEFYYEANEVPEEKKKALLVTLLGPDQYRLLATQIAPRKVAQLKYQECIDVMKERYDMRTPLLKHRLDFHSLSQKPGESLREYERHIRAMADQCQFKAEALDETLRDRFVIGVRSDDIRKRLMIL